MPKPDSDEDTVIFAEFQFQKDELLYERLFSEIMLYLARNPDVEDWRAIAVYPSRKTAPKPKRKYRSLLNSEQFQAIYLEDFLEMNSADIGVQLMQLIVSPKPKTARYLDGLIEQLNNQTTANRQGIIDLVSTIMVYKFENLTREEIESMFTVSDVKQTKVYQEAFEEGREEGREEGMEEGREAGLTEGMRRALAETLERERAFIIRLLTRKIGEISANSTQSVQSLSFEQLELLGESLLDFESLSNLENWLAQYGDRPHEDPQ